MNVILHIFLLIIGFVFLTKGADYLVIGASSLAKKMSVSEIAIGLTVVSFGTSMPELIVNIFANIQGKADIAFGNIIGSNIVNILLILGVAGIIYPIKTAQNTVWKEIPCSLLAVFALLVLCNDFFLNGQDSVLSRGDGIVLLLFFLVFLIYVFGIPRVESHDKPDIKMLSGMKTLIFIVVGLAGLMAGGRLVVMSAVEITKSIGISERLIGFTVVAVGTSLPELFTSAVAAYKGKCDIAIGNVVGSNIFNIFFILGVSALIAPLPFQLAFNVDILILAAASIILFFTMFTGKKHSLDRWESILFVILYLGYTIFLIMRK
ncbi:MAG TPA: calcium/sodium antiporter [Anaerolineae bacterium]|nr:calcium/sodium antiporter [Anaerolineae bacterium]